jgi:tetratricopeptide (TPR) repeat protein
VTAPIAVSRRTGRLALLPALSAIGLLLAASIALQRERDRGFASDQPAAQILYVQSPEVMKRLVLAYDGVAADVYWIRALQHFGGTRQVAAKDRRYALLFPLLDMATSLDPHFNIAYRFGAIFLAEPAPGGPGRPDQAIRLLEKGLVASPDKWEYMQDIGFVHYWGRHDYVKAAEWFEKASRIPGAAWFLKPLAATTLARGGDRSASRLLFEAIAASEGNEWMRKDAQRRLRQLDAMDGLDALRRVVALYRQRGGTTPITWERLVGLGLLRDVPRDPDGYVFALGPWSGDVSLGEGSTLAPLPDEPAGRRAVPAS